MTAETADNIEKTTGALGIELNCKGLFAFIHKDDPTRVAIAGEKGIVILSRQQAVCLAFELVDIVEEYLEDKKC
ncbi:MAG: hypothetical protein EOM14_11400 [Clostridia bacterium]|nr:hypothetical protein [Clostridia bacterium]